MGGVVDTCVFVAAERRGSSLGQLLARMAQELPDQSLVASSITAAELVQGIYQGDPIHSLKRKSFVRDIVDTLEIVPFSRETAWIAGRIRGQQAAAGSMLPVADSLIAATALELGYAIITQNVKDFERIPGLKVLPFSLS
jgi:tRNA(fMet)-specific endonuclease VapC